jgi:hypothetical protein
MKKFKKTISDMEIDKRQVNNMIKKPTRPELFLRKRGRPEKVEKIEVVKEKGKDQAQAAQILQALPDQVVPVRVMMKL